MSYVVNRLTIKKEENEVLLSLVNKQLNDGNVFRSEFEINSAKKSKIHYEVILCDINEKLAIIK